jgi:hypothetical protein
MVGVCTDPVTAHVTITFRRLVFVLLPDPILPSTAH